MNQKHAPEQPSWKIKDNEWRDIEFSPATGSFYVRMRLWGRNLHGPISTLEDAVAERDRLEQIAAHQYRYSREAAYA